MSATILCVQNDRDVCGLYGDSLEAEGYQALRAHDGVQALEVLRRHSPDFVVLDVCLPRQDGFEILAEIRSRPDRAFLPVLLLSEADVSEELEARAESLGAIGVVPAPIEPAQLVARVAEHVKAPPVVEAASRVAPAPREGVLRQIPFPELLHRVHAEGLDGVLLLERGRKKKAVELQEGWPARIRSNLVSECLGAYLAKMGRCTDEQLSESLERMRGGEGMQGEILVAMDVLDEEEMVVVLREHALAKLYEVFGWPDGRFVVRPRAHVQKGSSIALDGHPSKLVVEGVRRATPLARVDRFIEIHSKSFIVPREGASDTYREIDLSPMELEWIHALDGSLQLGSLAQGPESLRRLVYGLMSVELLDVASRPGDRNAACATAAAVIGADESSASGSEDEEAIRSELAELANRMQEEDHFGVLGVAASASDEEIRNAFAALAKRVHPDRFHAASGSVRQLGGRVFERVSEAHKGISTAEARAAYARERNLGRRVAEVEDEGRRALQAETEFQRGQARMAERDYEGALQCFGRAIESYPAEGEYRSHYGWCLHLCHPDNDIMLEEALEHCREGVKLAKDREKPYLLLGRLYKAMGKTVTAKKMFMRAVQIKPQCVEAMRELRIMNMRRDKEKGVLKRLFRR
ncbi:MAG: response regulator [Deltaproteobacteria bacterium]|jgi:CheY-like chemotaxis protein/tetratricopeptide (TPR) repeat protein|nr:response regulator [Deltaproteobacteria bacterium]